MDKETRCINTLDEYFKKISKAKERKYRNIIRDTISMYKFIKGELTSDVDLETSFRISDRVFDIENAMPYKCIIDINTKFELLSNNMFLNKKDLFELIPKEFSSKEELLNTIVSTVRNIIFNEFNWLKIKSTFEGFDSIDLENTCEEVSNLVKEVCDYLKVECEVVRIDPGFNKTLALLDGHGFHYFNILTIENERILLDLSYKQFFTMKRNNLERLGTFTQSGCLAGIYMIQNESRLKTAKTLLLNGWIELTEENMKNYFDGFALSYRNGLYYDALGVVDFTTNYTANDYENFIYGDDNQVNHEDEKMLGYQDEHLVNTKLDFTTGKRFFENESDNEFVKELYLNIKR